MFTFYLFINAQMLFALLTLLNLGFGYALECVNVSTCDAFVQEDDYTCVCDCGCNVSDGLTTFLTVLTVVSLLWFCCCREEKK